MANLIKTIECPRCETTWSMDAAPDGKGYKREALLIVAPVIAAHMRDKHKDEAAAIRFEKWAVTSPPWTSKN